MSFYKRYELRRLLADGEAKTFTAVANDSGREVLLHMFDPAGRTLLADFKGRFLRPDGSVIAPAIEIGEFAGSPYAVTETAEPFLSLRQWLQQQALGAALLTEPGAAPPLRASATNGPERDEFARVVDPGPAAPPQPPLLADDPGDFFPASGRSTLKAAPAPASAVTEDPGEFTRLFGSDLPAPAAPTPLVDDPGDFTRAFGPPPPKAAAPSAAKLARRPDPDPQREAPPPLVNESGDFTRAYGPPKTPPPGRPEPLASAVQTAYPAWPPERPAPPPPAPSRPAPSLPPMPERSAEETGEFTRLFGSGLPGQSIDIAEEQAKAARATAQETRPFQQAGEFTRIFGPESGAEPGASSPPTTTFSLNTSASNLFGSPEDLARQAGAPAAAGALVEGDAEYARKFGGSSKPSEPPLAAASKPAAPEPLPRRGLSPLMIVLITLGSAGAVAGLIVLAVWLGTR